MGGWRVTGAFTTLTVLGLGLAVLTAHPPPVPLKTDRPQILSAEDAVTRIAIGSCADQNLPAPIWSAIRKDQPDLYVAMGDNVYGDVATDDPAMPEMVAAYKALDHVWSFRRLRREVPMLAIWDDHDYGRNDAGADFPLKEESKALFMRFWGVPADSPRARRPGLYDSVIIGEPGRRIQILLLDTRWFRSPWKPTAKKGSPGAERYVPDESPGKTMLGAEQWAWLEKELKQDADLRLVVSSIQVIADGHGYEKWGNLPRERARLFDLIAATGAKGVVFLSGDRHVGALYKRDQRTPYPFFEITASSLNRPAPIEDEPEPERLGPLYSQENYGLVTIDWARRTVMLELKDIEGQGVMAASVPLAALAPPARAPALVHEGGSDALVLP